MTEGDSLNVISASYEASAVQPDQYPAGDFIEIAFIGRSNVGKSSLLNSLSRRRSLARISGTPGKTRTINFYRLTVKQEEERRELFLVDLPGYGYAKTGQTSRGQWSRFTEDYLLQSPRLKLICQLIDIRHPPMASDAAAYRWLTERGLPVRVVATKADKIGRSVYQKQTNIIKNTLGMKDDNVIIYSSVKGLGRTELLDVIAHLLLK